MHDLEAYLERIDYRGPVRADIETLNALHLHHPLAIPFENISTVCDEPVAIDLDSIVSKLIVRGRGGYCFEHNTLFQSVLERIGFDVVALAARVVWSAGSGHVNPRTHMVLMVSVDAHRWLVDVGFGGATLTAPLAMDAASVQETPHESYRLVREVDEFELQVKWAGDWRGMYRFDLQRQLPIDFEAMNHYVATYPRSHFRSTLMAGRALEGRRLTLQNGHLAVLREGEVLSSRSLVSGDELRAVLVGEFGIALDEIRGLAAGLAKIAAAAAAPAPRD